MVSCYVNYCTLYKRVSMTRHTCSWRVGVGQKDSDIKKKKKQEKTVKQQMMRFFFFLTSSYNKLYTYRVRSGHSAKAEIQTQKWF